MSRRIPHALFACLAVAALLCAGTTFAEQAPDAAVEPQLEIVDLPVVESADEAAIVEELLFAEPEAQPMSCLYTCPNGNPHLCPFFPGVPIPDCVNGCCVY